MIINAKKVKKALKSSMEEIKDHSPVISCDFSHSSSVCDGKNPSKRLADMRASASLSLPPIVTHATSGAKPST